jgi:hypothetical protein
MHDGKPVHFPDGVYHLRYLIGTRRVWSVSATPSSHWPPNCHPAAPDLYHTGGLRAAL